MSTNLVENITYVVTYNLVEYEKLGFLPSAWVVKCNSEGVPTYAEHKVYSQTLEDYGIKNTESRKELFEIIELLQIENLEIRFKPKKARKVKPIYEIIEDREVKKVVVQFIQRNLDQFLRILVKNEYLLSTNFERKDFINTILVPFSKKVPKPELFFKRTEAGIQYRLSFIDENGPWGISSKNISVITNEPAWVIIDQVLYNIPDINGNMLKPFLKKEELAIPKSYVKEYFQKFILRVVAKATINAEGFTVVNDEVDPIGELEVVEDFLDQQYGISLNFAYANNRFFHGETATQKTQLHFDNGDDVIVYQHKRNSKKEQAIVKKLESFGLKLNYGSFFQFIETNTEEEEFDPYFVHAWISENYQKLKKAGFRLDMPEIEQRKITLLVPSIELNLSQENDWFDLFGNIVVGKHVFPFSSLADYIRNEDRFFPLPDGSFFIIPIEWMNKYSSLFQMGKVKNGSLMVAKSQYTLLEDLELTNKENTKDLSKNYKRLRYKKPDTLLATLRPYQITGIKWLIHLYHNDLGACLADDMGLGKTLQTIAMLLYAKEQLQGKQSKKSNDKKEPQLDLFSTGLASGKEETPLNSMIIMPASLVFNWENEIRKFAPSLSVYKFTGVKRQRSQDFLKRFDVILTSYNTALKDKELLNTLDIEYLILDESQQIKNKNSKIFTAVNELNSEHKISLSGTPIENSLSDLWSQMQFINPELLGDFRFFKKEFIKPIEKHQDEEKKEQLRGLVAPYLLRRTKGEVAKDLPELAFKVFYTEMTEAQRKLYESEKSAARNYILDNLPNGNTKINMMILSTLLKLRQIANHPRLYDEEYDKGSGKFNNIIHRMELIRKGKHKVLIFSQFVKHLNLFEEWLIEEKAPYTKLTGSTPTDKRESEIKRFETDPNIKFFLISLKAGGAGLNLTAADYVFIADPWWNPSVEQQAIARAHRIGQDKNVMAVKFITKDTIEEKILVLQQRKMQLADDIINHNDKISFNQTDIEFLLE